MFNGAIAITSLIVALWFGGIEMVEFVIEANWTPYSITVTADPVFLVWDESNSIPGSAFTIGNTIVIEERWRGTEREAYLIRHEMIHVRQVQALGFAMWPVHWFDILDIEPERGNDWARPEENDELMWVPGEWPRWYHFMSIELRLGG